MGIYVTFWLGNYDHSPDMVKSQFCIGLFHVISIKGMDLKFQAFPEIVEFHGVRPSL